MNLTALKQIITQTAGRSLLLGQKHSPAVLTGLGVVGFISTVAMAVKATPEGHAIVKESKRYLANAKAAKAAGHFDSEKEFAREIAFIYAKDGARLLKVYGPTLITGAATIGCFVGAQGIMQKRNAALAAAYAGLERGFHKYRDAVKEQLGEEKELELYRSETDEGFIDENGKNVGIKAPSPDQVSPYARFFDELSSSWSPTAEYNLYFLKAQENYCNDLLRARGHLFLNEVYDLLGIPRSQAGAVVGWVLSKDGDNFVDFNIYSPTEKHREFVNGQEHSILLDFNVQGLIYDRI